VVDATAGSSLVELARAGDAAAFEALVRNRTDAMYRLSLAIVGNETDAADALQESLIGAWRHLPSLRDAERFEVWLERIVVNTCRMALRTRSRRKVREIPIDHLDREAGRSGERDDAATLRMALAGLSADHRAVLALHYFEDRPVAEIAAVLGIPAGTAKSRLFKARGALVRAIESIEREEGR
jgi:RNA polymerase sigma factor (sigma-70 family)